MAEPKFAEGQKVVIKHGKNHNRVVTVTKRVRYDELKGIPAKMTEWWYYVDSTVGGSGLPFPEPRLRPYDPPEVGSWDDAESVWKPDALKATPAEETTEA